MRSVARSLCAETYKAGRVCLPVLVVVLDCWKYSASVTTRASKLQTLLRSLIRALMVQEIMASPTIDFSADMAAVFASLQADASLAVVPLPRRQLPASENTQYALHLSALVGNTISVSARVLAIVAFAPVLW